MKTRPFTHTAFRTLALLFALCAVTLAPAHAASSRDYTPVGFALLANFDVKLENPDTYAGQTEAEYAASLIPDQIKELDGKRVMIPAYMMPITWAEGGGVSEFLGMASTTSCCFGQIPRLTEIIAVKMADGTTTQSLMDSPLFLYGTLKVGPVVEDGYVTAVYSMICDKVTW